MHQRCLITLLLVATLIVGACSDAQDGNHLNGTTFGDAVDDHDSDDGNNDNNLDGDTTIDDQYALPAATCAVEVQPASDLNPLYRELKISCPGDVAVTGFVTAGGEPGRGWSTPRRSEAAREHRLRFYGLLGNKTFQYALFDADSGDAVARGEFTVPPLPLWMPWLNVSQFDPRTRRGLWFAATITSPRVSELGVYFLRAVAVFDRRGRVRFFHEVEHALGEVYEPLQGVIPFSNGEMVVSDVHDLLAIRPDGTEYIMFDLEVLDGAFQEAHHQSFVADWDAEVAVVLFDELGPGLLCDLDTPTEKALGDGIAVINRNGNELWRWSVFDHQQAVAPYQMNQCMCRSSHYGKDVIDWTHGNAVWPIPEEDAILLSLRNAMQIVKIDVSTGNVMWQMGPGLDFTWIGEDEDEDVWFRLQHGPIRLPNGNLLLFDNGNGRYGMDCRLGSWSRALELEVDEDAMTVEPVWEHRVPFSQAMGNVERLPTGETFIYNGWMGDAVEVTPDHDEIWAAKFPRMVKAFTLRYMKSNWSYEL